MDLNKHEKRLIRLAEALSYTDVNKPISKRVYYAIIASRMDRELPIKVMRLLPSSYRYYKDLYDGNVNKIDLPYYTAKICVTFKPSTIDYYSENTEIPFLLLKRLSDKTSYLTYENVTKLIRELPEELKEDLCI